EETVGYLFNLEVKKPQTDEEQTADGVTVTTASAAATATANGTGGGGGQQQAAKTSGSGRRAGKKAIPQKQAGKASQDSLGLEQPQRATRLQYSGPQADGDPKPATASAGAGKGRSARSEERRVGRGCGARMWAWQCARTTAA